MDGGDIRCLDEEWRLRQLFFSVVLFESVLKNRGGNTGFMVQHVSTKEDRKSDVRMIQTS